MVTTIITAGLAAFVAFVFSILNESIKARRSFTQRWDKDVFDRVSAYLASTTKLLHHANASRHAAPEQVSTELNDTHQQLRMNCEQLLLIADPQVADAALRVRRAAYAVVEVAIGNDDPRPGTKTPVERLQEANSNLTLVARSQLRLKPIQGTRLSD